MYWQYTFLFSRWTLHPSLFGFNVLLSTLLSIVLGEEVSFELSSLGNSAVSSSSEELLAVSVVSPEIPSVLGAALACELSSGLGFFGLEVKVESMSPANASTNCGEEV